MRPRASLIPTDLPLISYSSLIMTNSHLSTYDMDAKPDSPGEFIENASTPEDLESLNVDIKKLVRKV
jgi:hypothetical protein